MFDGQNKRVDFLVCGTQKAGTTALYHYLKQHPSLCMADKKEVHYFDQETFFQGVPDYEEYHKWFQPTRHSKLLGEVTPVYMYWHSAPRRIWEYNPNIKIILVLRNPIERAYSHWNMERDRNRESVSFWDAIFNEKERCKEALPLQHRVYSYLDRGFYTGQIKRLHDFFPVENILIIRHEELKLHHNAVLGKIFNFLGLSNQAKYSHLNVHAIPYAEALSEKEWLFLAKVFKHEIMALEMMLGWDCSEWLLPPTLVWK